MHLLLITVLSLFVAALALTSWAASRPRGTRLHPFGNVGEGFQPAKKTFLTDGQIATRNLVGKFGTDSAHVAVAGVSDLPIGLIADEAEAAEQGVAVHLFGLQERGLVGVASGAITAGDQLVAGAAGTLRKLPATTGTYYIVGRALKDAADTAPVEFVSCFPIQRVV